MNRNKNEEGSFTIEISMIFTLIVLTVLALLFTFLYMQQKASLVSAASFAAQQGAEFWRDSRSSMEKTDLNGVKPENSINYRVFDNLLLSRKIFSGYLEEEAGADGKPRLVLRMEAGDNLPGQKAVVIGEALGNRIKSSVLKPKTTKVELVYSNNGLRGRLTVEIIQEIKVPLGGIKRFFDGKETLTLRGKATAAIVEPAEYIRNIDLAIELSKRFKDELDLAGLLDRLKVKKQN